MNTATYDTAYDETLILSLSSGPGEEILDEDDELDDEDWEDDEDFDEDDEIEDWEEEDEEEEDLQ